jgi:polysaccharide biosynthesis protein PslH
MKVLVVAPFLSGLDSGNGGGVLTFRQISTLASRHAVSFLSFSGVLANDIEEKCRGSLTQICKTVETVPLILGQRRVAHAALRSFCLLRPQLASLCWLPSMQTALRDQLTRLHPDIVWIQFPQMAQYVALCGDIPCIMDVQDAYSLSGFRQAQRMRGVGGVRAWLDWVCWARYEAQHYARFATVLTLSEQDAIVLHALNPRNRTISSGLPLAESLPPPPHPPVPMQVGFACAFGHRPNIEGLQWFLDEVWPLILSQVPTARFVIAGRNPPPELRSRASAQVEFPGFVPSIFDFFAANTVSVVPLVSGGGVKIKMVEAMLAGSAIVATQIGVEGTGILPGKEALVENDPAAFAESVVRIILNPSLRAGLAAAARCHATREFSTEAWLSRVDEIFSRVVNHSAAA